MKQFCFRKMISISGMFLMLLSALSVSGRAQMGKPVSLMVDGQLVALNQPGIISQGRVLVPLRGIFERLGSTVNYDPMTRAITAERSGTKIYLALGSHQATVNGEIRALDVPPLNMGGRVLVPLRFVSEALGSEVKWDASARTVSILSRTGGIDITTVPMAAPSRNIGAKLINAISISPRSAATGQIITVTMTGAPGGTATTTIGNSQQIAMQETTPGTYVGSYVVPAGLQGTQNVAVALSLRDGRTDSLTNMNALSIMNAPSVSGPIPGVLPLELISPNPAAKVPQVFDVTGKTEPNAVVRLRVVANQNNEIYNSQTLADLQGNYHFQVDTGNLGRDTHLVLQLRAEDTAGKTSEDTRVELTRQ